MAAVPLRAYPGDPAAISLRVGEALWAEDRAIATDQDGSVTVQVMLADLDSIRPPQTFPVQFSAELRPGRPLTRLLRVEASARS